MRKILLTTVFRPFGNDDEYSTRHVLPGMFRSQLTKYQGVLGIRSLYYTFNLEFIAANLKTQSTVLQYPSLKEFTREINKGYDYIGISGVQATFNKVKKMIEIAREISSKSKIIIGSYAAIVPEAKALADYICTGEGISFLKKLLEESTDDKVYHPDFPVEWKVASYPVRYGGVMLAGRGCESGCEFCSTTHFYNKKYFPVLKTGKEFYDVYCRMRKNSRYPDRFHAGVVDEDFLAHKERAEELTDYAKKEVDDPISFTCFSTAKTVSQYTPEELVSMGVDMVWIGVESKFANYEKLKDVDMQGLFENLREAGINIIASMIIGYDFHTSRKIQEDIDYVSSLRPTMTQFTINTPFCGTSLEDNIKSQGGLLNNSWREYDSYHLLFKHPQISKEEIEKVVLDAYDQEYQALGFSIIRYIETQFQGYLKFKDSEERILRAKAKKYKEFCEFSLPIFNAAEKIAPNEEVQKNVSLLKKQLITEFGDMNIVQKAKSCLLENVFVPLERFKLKNNLFLQPILRRVEYRVPEKRYLDENIGEQVEIAGLS